MKQLVTFFSERPKTPGGSQLVGLALTDEILDHLKEVGMMLEPEQKTGQGIDLLLVYAPTLNEVMQKVHRVIPKEKTKVKFI